MRPVDFIRAKRDGDEHSSAHIHEFIAALTKGGVADYQVSAWLMAAYLNGLSPAETAALTMAMCDSGERVDPQALPECRVDKHSTGGVGDKTSLVVAPLLTVCGVCVPKMSGRGLGFSGGTVDKLESIPGLRTKLTVQQFGEQATRTGIVLCGQAETMAPADLKMYALRDVTSTVESVPLITASILSKKLACGADRILLDVKVGSGSFMKTREAAMELAQSIARTGKDSGCRVMALLTNMNEPLGWSIGNAIEVREAVGVLTGAGRIDERFRELCIVLAAYGVKLSGRTDSVGEARQMVESALEKKSGAEKLREMIQAQGGDGTIIAQPEQLGLARNAIRVRSDLSGFVHSICAEALGWLAVDLGAGRRTKADAIDPSVGIELMKKTGDTVDRGEVLANIYVGDAMDASRVSQRVLEAFELSGSQPAPSPLFLGLIDSDEVEA